MQIVRIGDGSQHRPSADTVGGKAANLARMAALGLPVPPAFVLPVDLCAAVVAGERQAKQHVADGLRAGIDFLEQATGRRFGDRRRPLLVSVRSGAARSMPGMLDTVLDVGCSVAALHGLVRMSGNPRFAWDCRRRFLESYGGVVLDLDKNLLAGRLAQIAAAEGGVNESALDGEAMERLARAQHQAIEDEGDFVPEDAMEQLEAAAQAVYRSWMSERARTYRRLQRLDALQGTAVTVQAMVFGNASTNSGAGVAFSRDPSTGGASPVIEVLFGAQGEDVVSGSRTPQTEAAIERALPAVAAQLRKTLALLEREFADVQDAEFTIENGKLWMLQTRAAKRTPLAALRFAVDFVNEGLMTPAQGLHRLDGIDLATLEFKSSPMWRSRRRAASAPRPAWRSAARPSIPRAPNAWPPAASRWSWCGATPTPPMSPALRCPPVSSPPSAGAPPMPRWWRARWARRAWSAAPRLKSTTPAAARGWRASRSRKATGSRSTAKRARFIARAVRSKSRGWTPSLPRSKAGAAWWPERAGRKASSRFSVKRVLSQIVTDVGDQGADRVDRFVEFGGRPAELPHPMAHFGRRVDVDALGVGGATQKTVFARGCHRNRSSCNRPPPCRAIPGERARQGRFSGLGWSAWQALQRDQRCARLRPKSRNYVGKSRI